MDKSETTMWTVGIIGAVIGIGQLLASGDKITARYALGRSILSTGIALSSFSVLAWLPDASPPLLVGVSALMASLGSSGLTMLAHRFFNPASQILTVKEFNDSEPTQKKDAE